MLAHLSLVLDIDLCVTCDTCREVGGQGDSLVQSIGVQRLGMTQDCSHGLDTGTAHVVERILLGQRPAGGL